MQNKNDWAQEVFFCRHIDAENADHLSLATGRFLLLFVLSGEAVLEMNGQELDINPQKFVLQHPHAQTSFRSVSDDFKACCIGSNIELNGAATYNIPPSFLALILRKPVWDMDEETTQAARAFCTLFEYNQEHIVGSNSTNIATLLLTIFVQIFFEQAKHRLPDADTERGSVVTQNVLSRFLRELREQYRQHHSVTYYAEQAFVSTKYMTQVVKRAFGMTPKEIIDRKLAVEAMYLLAKSTLSVQEVSNELGFPNQSYFGRFFKRMLGLSPLAFRNNPDMRLMSRLKPLDPSSPFMNTFSHVQ